MKNHSRSTGLTAMLNMWFSDIDQGRIIEIMNIDLRKAFNLVNHEILLTKLSLYGVNNLTINWFRSYLHNREQFVQLGSVMSEKEICNCGIPQGSIFQYRGALLWNMLPTNICKIDDLQTFKNALKKHIVKGV